MKAEDIRYFETLLKSWLKELTSSADNTVVDLISTRDISSDPVDQASFDMDRNYTLRLRDREHHLIRKIRQAIENIENGTYGICEMCGEDISIGRLKARPVATYCIDCKRKVESMEKMVG
ncbi:MAG: RNA polymerase-binding protein DksA [Desulfobacteraceae bacterium]|jgi:DnaK suppressor protein|nr:MAG: RNA polymerase-binding protein DksA [Desulfobacteraceae bacterium]